MFALRNPSVRRLDRFLAAQERRGLSYSQVGQSLRAVAPDGAFINEGRTLLGKGEATYECARRALAAWRMFPGGWLRAYTREVDAEVGNVVATVARSAGLWVVNTCRVVYVHEERGEDGKRSDGAAFRVDESLRDSNRVSERVGHVTRSFAIGYGTLEGHLMRGEERFRVSWDPSDDSVWYEVWSFSWPNRWMAWLALPLVRRLQRRFAVESGAALRAAMQEMETT